MDQDVNKWQLREAESLAAREGISVDDALARVRGVVRRPRKAVPAPRGAAEKVGDKDAA